MLNEKPYGSSNIVAVLKGQEVEKLTVQVIAIEDMERQLITESSDNFFVKFHDSEYIVKSLLTFDQRKVPNHPCDKIHAGV